MGFGDRLLEILNEREISQRDFAAELNIAPTTLNGYIKNKRQPDFELVRRIAFSLNVPLDFLFDCGGSTSLDIHELALISKLRKMNSDERRIVYELVNTIDKHKK